MLASKTQFTLRNYELKKHLKNWHCIRFNVICDDKKINYFAQKNSKQKLFLGYGWRGSTTTLPAIGWCEWIPRISVENERRNSIAGVKFHKMTRAKARQLIAREIQSNLSLFAKSIQNTTRKMTKRRQQIRLYEFCFYTCELFTWIETSNLMCFLIKFRFLCHLSPFEWVSSKIPIDNTLMWRCLFADKRQTSAHSSKIRFDRSKRCVRSNVSSLYIDDIVEWISVR